MTGNVEAGDTPWRGAGEAPEEPEALEEPVGTEYLPASSFTEVALRAEPVDRPLTGLQEQPWSPVRSLRNGVAVLRRNPTALVTASVATVGAGLALTAARALITASAGTRRPTAPVPLQVSGVLVHRIVSHVVHHHVVHNVVHHSVPYASTPYPGSGPGLRYWPASPVTRP